MSNWGHGYNVEQGYTYNAFKEMSPEWLDFAASLNGYQPPDREDGFRYLEMGSGQGFGLCILAACYPDSEFVGIDFNPEHIAHSRYLAKRTGLNNVRFIEGDFAELAEHWPNDLGTFHYVVQHGIYSWIPSKLRPALVRCLDHATEPGSLIYVSYNAMPGWAASMAMQHLSRRVQVTTASDGPNAIKQTLGLLESLEEAGAVIFKAYPTLKTRVQNNKVQDPAYLVHEYLHDEWNPLWFSRVASEMAASKLSFVGSATIVENMAQSILPASSRKILSETGDPVMRQELTDCIINQGFRRDLFCRGARKAPKIASAVTAFPLVWVGKDARPGEDIKAKTTLGELKVKVEIHMAVAEALSKQERSVAQLQMNPVLQKLSPAALVQTIVIMMSDGYLLPSRQRKIRSAHQFNAGLASLVAEQGASYQYGAAPLTGNNINLSVVDMIMLDRYARSGGAVDTSTLQAALAQGMAHLQRKFIQNGQELSSQEQIAAVTAAHARQFLRKIPNWKRQGVIN